MIAAHLAAVTVYDQQSPPPTAWLRTFTPLYLATVAGHADAAQELIACGAVGTAVHTVFARSSGEDST